MKKVLAFIRGSMHTIAGVLVVLVVLVYLAIHSILTGPLVKDSLCDVLSEQLETRVTVDGGINVNWFNQVVLNQLTIYDQQGDTLIYARRALVAFDFRPLLRHHLVLNTCQLIDFDIRTYRTTADAPANFQFMVDALSKKDNPDKQPFVQQFDLNTIHLRKGRLSYDVLNAPERTDLPFDPNHIAINQLGGNIHVHDKELRVTRFHCYEHQTSIEARQLRMALNFKEVLDASAGEHRFLATVKLLQIDSDDLTARLDLEGTSDQLSLNIRQLSMPNGHPALPGITQLKTNASISIHQLRNPLDSLYFTLDVGDLQFNHEQYGLFKMSGSLDGMPCDADINVLIAGCQGSAAIDAQMLSHVSSDSAKFTQRDVKLIGHCQSEGIDLAQFTSKSAHLGLLSFDVRFDLEKKLHAPLHAACDGNISRLDWHGYTYRDIELGCQAKAKHLSGNVAINDSLVSLAASFNVDHSLQRPVYQLDGDIRHINPYALQLTTIGRLDSLAFGGSVHADVKARRFRDADIDILLGQVSVGKGDRQLDLGDIRYRGTPKHGHLESQLARLYYTQRSNDKQYHFEGGILPFNDLFAMLDYDIRMSKELHFEARTDSLLQFKSLHVNLPKVEMQQGIFLASNLDMKDDAQGLLHPMLDFEISNPQHRLTGTLKGHLNTKPLDVHLDPAIILLNKEELHLTEAHLLCNEAGDYILNNLSLSGSKQEISASGILGKDKGQQFNIRLKNFDLGQVLNTLPKNYLHFGGRVTGALSLSSDPDMHLRADSLDIRDFSYIGELLGNANMKVDYDVTNSLVGLDCAITTDSLYNSHLTCDLTLGKHKTIDLQVEPDHLPLGFIKNWCGSILQKFTGCVTGGVRLYGDLSNMQLEGTPVVDGRFTHNIIGANFHFNDKVKLSPGLIHLDNITMDDCHGHNMKIDARVTHHFLHDFGYDVKIDMPNNKQGFLVLDRQPAEGRIYWGQLYAKGTARMYGGNGRHRINLHVGTTDKSWFYLSPREQEVNLDKAAYGFLTFRDKNQLDETPTAQQNEAFEAPVNPQTDLVVNIQLEASEQCEVTVQMDPMSEDILKGRGHGNLSVVYDPRQDIRLSGEYQITNGTYTMNIKPDLMRKEFQLRNTSRVKFSGVPSEADLELNAYYNIPSVNLADLGPGIASMGSVSRRTAPVDCDMKVRGHLSSPQVSFGLDIKNVNEDIKTKVNNVIGTEEMINQEVLYLLLFSKFYTPQNGETGQNLTGAEVTAFASASITSQINQLLGHISDSFRMGTNVRTDKGDFTDMEMDLSLSTRLLGDRLLLNGNVGYRDPANRLSTVGSTNSFIGDFDIEWLMTKNGKLRLKAFSHYNERDYSINNALSTQGASIILRHDFYGLSDMWRWKLRTKKPKVPAAKPDEQNTDK